MWWGRGFAPNYWHQSRWWWCRDVVRWCIYAHRALQGCRQTESRCQANRQGWNDNFRNQNDRLWHLQSHPNSCRHVHALHLRCWKERFCRYWDFRQTLHSVRVPSLLPNDAWHPHVLQQEFLSGSGEVTPIPLLLLHSPPPPVLLRHDVGWLHNPWPCIWRGHAKGHWAIPLRSYL